MAFAAYGMAVVLAPAIGPTLGGWITDNFSWRWIFFINIPVGIISLFLTGRLITDPPYIKRENHDSLRLLHEKSEAWRADCGSLMPSASITS